MRKNSVLIFPLELASSAVCKATVQLFGILLTGKLRNNLHKGSGFSMKISDPFRFKKRPFGRTPTGELSEILA